MQRSNMPTTEDFRRALSGIFRKAQQKGRPYVEVNSGEFHRGVGGYPGRSHRMPPCCSAMYQAKTTRDTVLHAPPRGKGASLTIRYVIPR